MIATYRECESGNHALGDEFPPYVGCARCDAHWIESYDPEGPDVPTWIHPLDWEVIVGRAMCTEDRWYAPLVEPTSDWGEQMVG